MRPLTTYDTHATCGANVERAVAPVLLLCRQSQVEVDMQEIVDDPVGSTTIRREETVEKHQL
jgi:hypothetical protein